MRQYRADGKWKPVYNEKTKARAILGVNLRRGKIKKQSCAKCGSGKSQAHHPDYSKPLEVVWLCRKHHDEVHRAARV